MIAAVLRVGGLLVIYLLVLTSLAPGDVLVGSVLAAMMVVGTGWRSHERTRAEWSRWFLALGRMTLITAWEVVVGTVRVGRFCLTGAGRPGLVEIPRGDRSRHGVALWGVLTGEAPDEYPVAVDDERDVLIVHNVDASDPGSILARHAAARDGHQARVVP
jgi:multisubunit Na+/H+ antiporter MnhE subunit